MSTNWYSPGLKIGCMKGQLDVVRAQLAAGEDPNVGWTKNGAPLPNPSPLHDAACWGHEAVCRLLLEHGADPNIVADRREPPLHYACSDEEIRCPPSIATLLLDFGADIDATDGLGRTPLMHACWTSTSNVELVTILLDRGANILKGIPSTPLWVAVDAGKVEVARLLLQHGAPADIGFDPSHPPRPSGTLNSCGMDTAFVTPLYHRLRQNGTHPTLPSARAGVSIARLLLAHGASFDREHRVFDRQSGDISRVVRVETPLSLVRSFGTAGGGTMREMNELFDSYLTHYWRLRVKLRVFGPVSEHLLDLHVAPFLIGEGVLKKRTS